MSDTENKTEAHAETKSADTAPDIKKDDTPASSKSNLVIPLVLILVSAIVIIATFYEDEYNSLIAATNSEGTDADAKPVDTSAEEQTPATVEASSNTETVALNAAENLATETQTTENQAAEKQTAEINDQNETVTGNAALSNTEVKAVAMNEQNTVEQQKAGNIAPTQPQPSGSAFTQPANAPYQRESYDREQSMTEAQKQRYNEMKQRRQAYEKEMEARRLQYETAQKARQEKRAKFLAEQKAMFQRMEKNRLETNKKIQDIQKRISELHEELHQIMRESRAAYRKPAAVQQ